MRIGMALNYSGGFAETAAEAADLERAGLDDEVALLLQDAVHPRDGLLRLAGRLDDEDVVVLVLEVGASLARSPASAAATGDDLSPTVDTFVKSTS